jgi:uncharacterized protein (TIGR02599 family)
MSMRSPQGNKGFTLIEILVSTAVLAMLLVILLSITSQASTMWRYTSSRIEQFRQAREAFDVIGRRLSQATLNTYWDYDDPTNPTRYIRQSELRFISGPMTTIAGGPPANAQWPSHGVFFQASLGAAQPGQSNLSGLNSLLNTWGYFLEFGSDASFRPSILDSSAVPLRYRFRLCELIQPANNLNLYDHTSGPGNGAPPNNLSYTGRDWFTSALNSPPNGVRQVHVLAENVIALILLPKLPIEDDPTGANLAKNYLYDSTTASGDEKFNQKNQLPPIIQLTVVSLDEGSARRLENGSNMPDLGLSGLFTDPSQYDSDIQRLEKNLADKHLSYRVFTTSIHLREAKWSTEQQN